MTRIGKTPPPSQYGKPSSNEPAKGLKTLAQKTTTQTAALPGQMGTYKINPKQFSKTPCGRVDATTTIGKSHLKEAGAYFRRANHS